MFKQFKFVFAVGILAVGGIANATTCPSAIASYTSCSGTPAQIASCQETISASHPECFGGSSNTAAASKIVQATSLEQMLAISSNVSSRFAPISAPPGSKESDSGERKGMAAGNSSRKMNFWASFAESDLKYDRGVFFFNAANRTNKFDSRIDNLVLGADYQSAPNLVFGLSAAFDRGRGSAASYDITAVTAAKSVTTSGYSFAPYLGWQINKDWALDATIGWGNGENTTDSTVTTDSKRFFYGANLGYAAWSGNWQLTGKGSYLFGQEKSADSKNSGTTLVNSGATNEVGQFRLAGQAAYWMNGVMPYVGLAYALDGRSGTATADQRNATEMGKSAWVWSLGANFISIKNAMTGGVGYEQETGRSRSKNSKLMANINMRF